MPGVRGIQGIEKKADETGYPPNLDVLVDGKGVGRFADGRNCTTYNSCVRPEFGAATTTTKVVANTATQNVCDTYRECCFRADEPWCPAPKYCYDVTSCYNTTVCAQSQQAVIDAEVRFYEEECANVHRGAACERITLAPPYAETALRAAASTGLAIAGFDMLETPAGPVVLEVNSSPGFEGLEGASGLDIAASILEHVFATADRGVTA